MEVWGILVAFFDDVEDSFWHFASVYLRMLVHASCGKDVCRSIDVDDRCQLIIAYSPTDGYLKLLLSVNSSLSHDLVRLMSIYLSI